MWTWFSGNSYFTDTLLWGYSLPAVTWNLRSNGQVWNLSPLPHSGLSDEVLLLPTRRDHQLLIPHKDRVPLIGIYMTEEMYVYSRHYFHSLISAFPFFWGLRYKKALCSFVILFATEVSLEDILCFTEVSSHIKLTKLLDVCPGDSRKPIDDMVLLREWSGFGEILLL